MTGSVTTDDILDRSRKQSLDYYVVTVVVVQWLRFFAYFLVIRSISKLLMTLVKMLQDTVGFAFIMACYLVLAASVYTTLFQSIESSMYGSLSLSMRTLYDTMLGNYGKVTLSRHNDLHTYLTMLHLVASNIFLLNYLIAILSSAYEYMRDVGEFDYKATRYAYVEKYQTAFTDKRGYAELVVHPAPIGTLTLFLLPALCAPKAFPDRAEVFAKLMYWAENLFFMLAFVVYACLLMVAIFFKVLYNLFRSMRLLSFPPVALLWIVFGFVALPLFVAKDLFYLVSILCDYGDTGDAEADGPEGEEAGRAGGSANDAYAIIANEVMDVMRAVFVLAKKQRENQLLEERLARQQPAASAVQPRGLDDDEASRLRVDKSLIVAAWRRYRPSGSLSGHRDEETSAATGLPSNNNFISVVGEAFVKRIMSNIAANNSGLDDASEFSYHDDLSDDGSEVPEDELGIVGKQWC